MLLPSEGSRSISLPSSRVQGGGSGLEWPHPISLASPREAAVASCPPTSRRRSSKTAASPGGYASFPLRRRGKGQRPRRPGTISREGSGSGLMSPSIARTGRGHGCFPRRCLRVSRRGLFSASGDARRKSRERAQRRRTTTTKPCVSAGVDAEPATTAVPSERSRAGPERPRPSPRPSPVDAPPSGGRVYGRSVAPTGRRGGGRHGCRKSEKILSCVRSANAAGSANPSLYF